MIDTPPATTKHAGPLPGARTVLTLLLAINLFNYIDRQVLSAVQMKVEEEFGRSKAEIGLLASMFLISYTLAAPVFGWLGDRMSRWTLVGIGVIVWSLASGGTGLAPAFGIMLLTRALIGIGEGAYGPVAPTLIADVYPVEHRGAKMAWFFAAIPVGSALGYALGGAFAPHDWRWAFYVVVPPGVLLGVICFMMREPRRGATDGVVHRTARFRDYLTLLRTPSYVLCSLGMTAMTFTLGGVAVWIPTYYYERESVYMVRPETYDQLRKVAQPPPDAVLDTFAPVLRRFGIDAQVPAIPEDVIARLKVIEGQKIRSMDAFRAALGGPLTPNEVVAFRSRIAGAARVESESLALGTIGLTFGGIVALTGLGATLAGGWLGDKLRPRWPGSYFLVSGVGMLLGFPLFLLAVDVPLPWGWVCCFGAVFFLFFNTGPSNTILANVTHPAVRSSAYALNILVLHLLGDVASPPIVGWIDGFASLRHGMYLLSGAILVSGVLWLWGARYLERDTRLAPTRLA